MASGNEVLVRAGRCRTRHLPEEELPVMAFYLVSAHQPQERRGSPSQAGSRGAYDKKPRALPVSITPAASADRALEQALRQRAIGLLPDIDPRHYFSARLATTA